MLDSESRRTSSKFGNSTGEQLQCAAADNMPQKRSRVELILTAVSCVLLVTCIALIIAVAIHVKPGDPEPKGLSGQMEMGVYFTEELRNTSSLEFKSLAHDVQHLISKAYDHSELRLLFLSSKVLLFSRDYSTVVVHFDLWFSQQIDPYEASVQLAEGLRLVPDNGLHISIWTIEITEKRDPPTPAPATTTAEPPTTILQCLSSEEKCADGSKCIKRSQICDGVADCPGATDEDADSCATVCDGQFVLTAPNGSFSSSGTSANNTRCQWIIRVDQGFSIQVDVQFTTERISSMSLYEGVGEYKFLAAVIGRPDPSWTVWLLRNVATVDYRVYPQTGFSATYRATNVSLSNLTNEEKVTCDFEQGMCFWRQRYSMKDYFRRERGSTFPELTGPSVDHTLGNSSGFYITTTPGSTPEYTEMISHSLSPTEEPMCLRFWYHMYGEDVYRLSIRLSPGPVVFQEDGNHGDEWNYGQVTLYLTSKMTVRFEAFKKGGLLSEIALDDITLTSGACGPAPPEPTSVPLTPTPEATTTLMTTPPETVSSAA